MVYLPPDYWKFEVISRSTEAVTGLLKSDLVVSDGVQNFLLV